MTTVKTFCLPLLYLCCTSFLPLLKLISPPVRYLLTSVYQGWCLLLTSVRPLLEYLLVSVGKVPALLGYPYYLKF